jgi:hypothetical protein
MGNTKLKTLKVFLISEQTPQRREEARSLYKQGIDVRYLWSGISQLEQEIDEALVHYARIVICFNFHGNKTGNFIYNDQYMVTPQVLSQNDFLHNTLVNHTNVSLIFPQCHGLIFSNALQSIWRDVPKYQLIGLSEDVTTSEGERYILEGVILWVWASHVDLSHFILNLVSELENEEADQIL